MKKLKLRDYQTKAIKFSLKYPRSYQALDMGLGKTVIALTWAANIMAREKDIKGVLVIAPLSTLHTTWPDEIAKWRPELTYTVLHGPEKDNNLGKDVDIYLINYQGIKWLFTAIKRYFKITGKIPFRAVIWDEGSMLKSSTTKRFKMFKSLKDLFPKWRMILSGTPAPNSLLDLWAQYFLLDDGERLGKFVTHYKQQHFRQLDRMGFIWGIRLGEDTIIFDKIKDITYRLDAEDYLELPKRIDNVIKIKLSDKERKQYDKLEKDFFLELSSDLSIEAFSSASLSMKLRQFLQGGIYTEPQCVNRAYEVVHTAKLKALQELVEGAAGQGILCAIQFKFELDMIKKKFPKAPVIAGGTHIRDTKRYIDAWNRGEIPLLLCHPASLSHGVNLQHGSHIVLWYGLTWSLEQYLQLNARLHRYGQNNTVIVHHLVIEKSIDTRVMKALRNKFKNQRELLDYIKGEK